ncbi:hypothetical protein FPQ18DRAFT_399790 [Pyronema domesticum]|uniref:Similar to VMS1 homolog C1827.04 acc. no. O74977 n=1 Tax=Pyronema omphalodes (strain CBS 100304) TaxID=1076935 RepID=U4KYN7_PYROM|nr:hypothetical protein FPQ18DRAFT_399790 [Pyronema domesticum]CCX04744.1 Similar to VMS1 homolog C1827.04; acc. no. O74977 [Pyronema omphalodes CBS 100304]
MTTKPNTENAILKRPLYIYDLPSTFLTTLEAKDSHVSTAAETDAPTEAAPTETTTDEHSLGMSCSMCGIALASVADQRAHYKSDWHRFNLKMKTRGRPAVTEPQFDDMLEGDFDESLSGSDESQDDDSEAENEDEQSTKKNKGPGKAPIIWFKSQQTTNDVSLGVYRALFSNTEQAEGNYLPAILNKQLSKQPKMPHIFMCMIGGGHFAAMIVSLGPKPNAKAGDHTPHILAQKSFHRYTTRRKQGGSQSANDNAKGKAKSAGANIRRQNEAMLINEIHALLAEWKEQIDSAELLFIRASGTQNRRTLFSYPDAILTNNDPRLRGFPFNTRRATHSELVRSFSELTRMKVSRMTPEAVSAVPSAPKPKPVKPAAPAAPVISPEEEEARMHTTQLTALIRRSKVPALLSYIKNNSISPNFVFVPSNHHSPTPLHLAASSNAPAIVTALLTKANADPTLTNDDGKTAFKLSGDKATREAFQIARHTLGESKWDWEKAGVAEALNPQDQKERNKKEKEEEEKAEKERRQQETERLKKMPIGKTKPGVALGAGGVHTAMSKHEEETRGMSQEMMKQLMRERMARAAERRIQG